MAAQLYLLQGYQRVKPIPEDEKDDAFWQIKCQSIKGGNVGANVAIFSGIYCVSRIYLEFPALGTTSSFLQAQKWHKTSI
jgi:hypothetical protein